MQNLRGSKTAKSQNVRVLLYAYQCGPGMGSVSQIGWEWYSRLSYKCQVTLLTHIRNRQVIENAGAPIGNSTVIYIDSEWFAAPLYRFVSWLFPRSEHPKFLITSVDFFVYDWLALRTARQLITQGHAFDVVHMPTPVSPIAATRLHLLKIPLFLGPWNGGLKSPSTFPEIMQTESQWLYSLRNIGKVLDWFFGTTRNAAMIFTATQSTLKDIASQYHHKCQYLLENGVNLDLFTSSPYPLPPSATNPLQIAYVGRLLPFKGVGMLLEAIKHLDFPIKLTIVGEGPERSNLMLQVKQDKLMDVVDFTGNLPLQNISDILRKAHVFCLPSIRESGGAVLLEAMAVARPVIAVDFGGPSEIVDDTIGVKLPATGHIDLVSSLVSALENVYQNPNQWQQRGKEGRRRVESHYSWDAKISTAINFYQQQLASHS